MSEVAVSKSDGRLSDKLGVVIAAIRIGFGCVWLLDALLKFNPSFYTGMLGIVKAADSDGPGWLDGWYNFWFSFLGSAPHVFAVLVMILECFIAAALLFGFSRKAVYAIGIVFSFLLWGVGEGFGRLNVSGTTDPNAAVIYIFPFLLLYVIDGVIPGRLALDNVIERQIGWWSSVSRRKD